QQRRLVPTMRVQRAGKCACALALQLSGGPKRSCRIDELLELRGGQAEASRRAEYESVGPFKVAERRLRDAARRFRMRLPGWTRRHDRGVGEFARSAQAHFRAGFTRAVDDRTCDLPGIAGAAVVDDRDSRHRLYSKAEPSLKFCKRRPRSPQTLPASAAIASAQ